MTHPTSGADVMSVDDPGDERVADYVGLSDVAARRRIERPAGSGESAGILIAEGMVVIDHLLRSPYRVRSFLVTELGLRALLPVLGGSGRPVPEAPIYLAAQPVMEAIAGFRFHRGALASAARRPLPDAAVLAAGPDPLAPRRLLVVEGVGDNENLGALFRNAAAFGIDAVLLDPTTADPLYRRSVRVSAGHALHMPFARMADWPVAAIATLQALGFEVAALTPSPSADDVRQLPAHPRRALLVGAEGPGLSAAALAAADRRVRIAMAPDVDSLNVATAAAIALHHLSTSA